MRVRKKKYEQKHREREIERARYITIYKLNTYTLLIHIKSNMIIHINSGGDRESESERERGADRHTDRESWRESERTREY